MPSRLVTAAIVVFWLGTNGWLFYREVLPRLRSGEPPAYTIDLTQELGRDSVSWVVLQKGERIGSGTSQVSRLPDRTYELRSQFKFEKLKIFFLADIKRMSSTYHVTEEGELLNLAADAAVVPLAGKGGGGVELELAMEGKVDGDFMTPRFLFNGEEVKAGLGKVPVSKRGSVLNPMHLVNRLPGLREGQTWRIPLFDPLGADPGKLVGADLRDLVGDVEGLTIPVLEATVSADTLTWDKAEVPCFKIDYREPGEAEVVAATWVRRADGLVLQQQASHGFLELVLQRVPSQ